MTTVEASGLFLRARPQVVSRISSFAASKHPLPVLWQKTRKAELRRNHFKAVIRGWRVDGGRLHPRVGNGAAARSYTAPENK